MQSWSNPLRRCLEIFGLCALQIALASGAFAQTIELKVSHFLPPNHTFQKALEGWKTTLEAESAGRLKVTIYPAGQLGGGANRQIDAARNGVVDVAVGLEGATPGRYPVTDLVTLPYAAPAGGTSSAVTSKRLTELAPRYLDGEFSGVRVLWMAVTPPLLFFAKKPVHAVADFKGLRIRYAGAQFKTLIDALGAVAIAVPPQDTQDALSKGIVDAATFPYEGAASFDLGNVVKYALEPGVSSASFAVVMNPAKYESLPPDLKSLIDRTTGPAAAEAFGRMWDAAEKDGKVSLLKKGVEAITLPAPELAKMKAIFAPEVEAAIAAAVKRNPAAATFFGDYIK